MMKISIECNKNFKYQVPQIPLMINSSSKEQTYSIKFKVLTQYKFNNSNSKYPNLTLSSNKKLRVFIQAISILFKIPFLSPYLANIQSWPHLVMQCHNIILILFNFLKEITICNQDLRMMKRYRLT